MTNSATATRPHRRVRPATWAILAWMLVMISAIIGAWQGSAARNGAIPSIVVATSTVRHEALPTAATDLDGNSIANPPVVLPAEDEQLLFLGLPVDLQRTSIRVATDRDGTVDSWTVPAGTLTTIELPIRNTQGRLRMVEVRAQPVVYDDEGAQTILPSAWTVQVRPRA